MNYKVVSQHKPFNSKEAAEYLGITKGALYTLVSKKKISCYRPTGKNLYFRLEDLDAFAFRNRTAAEYERNARAEDIVNAPLVR